MKIVFITQLRENYGAHNWNGEGECPQYWKCKGGETYVLEGVGIGQAQDKEFWARVEAAIEFRNESFEEYVISSTLLDDEDDVSNYHEEWETPTRMVQGMDEGCELILICKKVSDVEYSDDFKLKTQTWILKGGEKEDYTLTYLRNDGVLCDWQGNPKQEAA